MSELRALYSNRELYSRRIYEIYEVAKRAITDPSTQSYFKLRAGKADSYYKQFESLHADVVNALLKNQNVETVFQNEDEIRKCVDEHYFHIKAAYFELFEKKTAPKQEPASINATLNHSISEISNLRLPKITLPHFDGDYKLWSSYYDMFKRLVHDNASISVIEKFQYLVTSLSKEPLAIVKGFTVNESNYDSAFQALVRRYDNHRWLATAYFSSILNCPSAKNDSISEIRRLSNVFRENISSLKTLELPVEHWDFVFFLLLLQKVDIESRRRFELKIESSSNIPKFSELESFLDSQCRAFEIAEGEKRSRAFTPSKTSLFVNTGSSSSNYKQNVSNPQHNKTKSVKCAFCAQSNHSIYNCPKFSDLSPQDRYSSTKQKNLCVNCLSNHNLQNCNSKSVCRVCSKRHHTLLHFNKPSTEPSQPEEDKQLSESNNASSNSLLNATSTLQSSQTCSTVLLATLVLNVLGHNGSKTRCRAVLDSCSQSSFISAKCAARVGLKFSKCSILVNGIGSNNQLQVQSRTSFKIQSLLNDVTFDISALVLPQICNVLPGAPIVGSDLSYLQNLILADPDWIKPSKIDLLIGADLFAQILRPGIINSRKDMPTALNTAFGWVIMGPLKGNTENSTINAAQCTIQDQDYVDTLLKRFWEVEEPPCDRPAISAEDMLCERIYKETTTRDESGRYCVHLPFRSEPNLGETKSFALKRFLYLESRLNKDPNLQQQYHDFMKDYLAQNHMSLVTTTDRNQMEYFIPHHAVLKPDSSTSKCRVVFDASMSSTNGHCLNDNLLTGLKLQKDIMSIILRFRTHKIVFTADVKQMYRQINVFPPHQRFQKILWRFDVKSPIQEYALHTVTYGINSSPFLALRTIQQLCEDEGHRFPQAAEIAQRDIYIDDICSGTDSLSSALSLRDQLIALFKSGQFELRKWTSNHTDFLKDIAEVNREMSLSFDESTSIKILGLHFNPSTDSFFYKVKPVQRCCTKRAILSELAKIYDPPGFLSPLTLAAKCMMQHLWCLGLEWDAVPPDYVIARWNQYVTELPCISELQISRKISINDCKVCQLHGFCDASEKAYSAVVYFRTTDDSKVQISLIAAKSRVAPLKKLSLPRLELCAASLLADLIKSVLKIYANLLTIHEIYAWSDSTIALSWIKTPPYRFKTFVGNRVAHIQERVAPSQWFHVCSEDNPADVASRGCLPSELLQHPLWWFGPPWLQDMEFQIPPIPDLVSSEAFAAEERKLVLGATLNINNSILNLIERFSSLRFIVGVVFQCLKFCRRVKYTALTHVDYQYALLCLVKCVQNLRFSQEIEALNSEKLLSKPMRKLGLFLDSSGILRVGGRLINSRLPFCKKFPALLPNSHPLTDLIIHDFHTKNMHPGLGSLRYMLQEQFWILGAKRAITRVVSKCINCFKQNPRPLVPIMGNLPSFRVIEAKPFSHIGVDFGGHFHVTLGKHRGVKSTKAYICVFVCMATKAIHIELVSDLSTNGFLAALRRFMSRRGRVSHIYSDNGTNFVGAYRQILEWTKSAADQERLVWHFNPPTASAFGGIFEAGIKSVKVHLARVIGLQVLTYEELNTVLVQIEGILNSRPISPLSSDPHDLNALTPGHFLTSEALTSIPEPDLLDLKISSLSRWQLVQRMRQDFWSRWHNEYLHTLMQRTKDGTAHSLQNGSLVVIKNESLPPLKWRLARVVKLYPGSDDISRVADVFTTNGVFKRPVAKLCPLPTE